MKNNTIGDQTSRERRRIQYTRAVELEIKAEGATFKSQGEGIVAQKRLEDTERRVATLLRGNKMLKEDIASTTGDSTIAELMSSNRAMAEGLSNMEKRYSQLQALLDQRTQELKESQTYLNKPDEYPESVVVKKVEDINTRMFNMTMSIVDLFERSPKMDLEETFVQEECINRCRRLARSAIGELLYSTNCQVDEAILHRLPIVPEDSLPMQLALRCILVKWATRVIGTPGTFPANNEATDLYKSVRVREPQSVSSQWRLIAYRACPPALSSDPILDDILALLCVCGLSSLNPGFEVVKKNIRMRTTDTEKSLHDLRRIIHEGVTSSDMESLTVEPDNPYEPSLMVEAFAMGALSGPIPQRILCTVGLGLRKTTTKKTTDSGIFYLHTDLLKRPEVALIGLLDNFRKPVDPDFDAYLYQYDE